MTTEGQQTEDAAALGHISATFRGREHLREHIRHVAVEGAIGAGKTTLARLLAERLDARIVLEQFAENPFLERFYADPDRWAFQTQLSFLATRFRQQQSLVERDLFHHLVVSDYTFEKDRIFATVTLDGDEFQLYESLYRVMERRTPVPDLIIYLRASVDRLVRNIERRGRPFEAGISRSYLQELSEAYDYFFFRYTKSAVLIVNMEEVDFVENQRAVDELIRQIGSARYKGTIFYRASRPDLFDE